MMGIYSTQFKKPTFLKNKMYPSLFLVHIF